MTIKIGSSVRIHRYAIGISIILFILFYIYAIREVSYLSSRFNNKQKFVSLRSLLKSSIKASKLGGIEIADVHNNYKNINIEIKGKTKEGIDDPVTIADYKSHCAMYNYLQTMFPTINIISEESKKNCDDVLSSSDAIIAEETIVFDDDVDGYYDTSIDPDDITVWIDPLDATKEFTENLLNYVTTMVCIAIKGVPIIGIIHKPFGTSDDTYWAWPEHGYSKNLAAIKNSIVNDDDDGGVVKPILIVSRSHAGEINNISKNAIGDNVKIISAAGAGYKALEVISGNATAYVHNTLIKKWDICAGAAIITAMGGSVTSLTGQPLDNFGAKDNVSLDDGILATMKHHNWYLDKFVKKY